MMRGNLDRQALVALLIPLTHALGCNAILGIDEPLLVSTQEAGVTGCVLNSDCDDERLVCIFSVCSPRCARTRDCQPPQFCLKTSEGTACVEEKRRGCGDDETVCPAGTACEGGLCVSVCEARADCPEGQLCRDARCVVLSTSPRDGGRDDATDASDPTVIDREPPPTQPEPKPSMQVEGPMDAGGGHDPDAGMPPATPDAGDLGQQNPGADGGPPPVCTGTESECNADGDLRACDGTGQWGPANSCPFLCDSGACVGECVPDDVDCEDAVTPTRCSPEGKWVPQTACTGVCTAGQCAGSCAPGTRQCAGGDLLECDSGGIWQPFKACPFLCDPVARDCGGMCVPNATQCDGQSLEICESDGTWRTFSQCAFECLPSTTQPGEFACSECTRQAERCASASTAQVCDGTGTWASMSCAFECIGTGCVECVTGDGQCPKGCAHNMDGDCPKPNGVACAGAGECGSGRCVDGVCCASACTAACMACNIPGSLGTCTTKDFSDDPLNCGGCGASCSTNNITAECGGGACTGTCQAPYRDCNADRRGDGCETNPQNDADHCGGCGDACSGNNVTRACSAGQCSGTCRSPYRDCNSDLRRDGCETNPRSDADHCGNCGAACSGNNITRECMSGMCAGTCRGSYLDCNNDRRSDGCETDPNTDANHCGKCGKVCPYGLCQAGACVSSTWGFTGNDALNNMGADSMVGVPIVIGASTELVALRVGTEVAGVQVRLGLYSDNAGVPRQLLAQTPELTSQVGVTEGSVSPTRVSPGTYWVFILADQVLTVRQTNTPETWRYAAQPFGPLPNSPPALSSYADLQISAAAITAP